MPEGACPSGICGADVPPVIGSVLTGTGLTVEQAVARLEGGEALPALTDVQRCIVERAAVATASALPTPNLPLPDC